MFSLVVSIWFQIFTYDMVDLPNIHFILNCLRFDFFLITKTCWFKVYTSLPFRFQVVEAASDTSSCLSHTHTRFLLFVHLKMIRRVKTNLKHDRGGWWFNWEHLPKETCFCYAVFSFLQVNQNKHCTWLISKDQPLNSSCTLVEMTMRSTFLEPRYFLLPIYKLCILS